MTRSVSTSEAKNQLSALIGWAEEHDAEVIIEHHGKPRAVIMSVAEYRDMKALKERAKREDTIRQLRRLKEEVSSRNQDLTEDEAMALADRFVREVIDDLAREGKLVFERDGTQ